jgi:hypothetical protein
MDWNEKSENSRISGCGKVEKFEVEDRPAVLSL